MFTGIVEAVVPVRHVETRVDSTVLHIHTGFADVVLGESIAVNGVCLTVAAVEALVAVFYASPETLARTNLGALAADHVVNLERAVTPASRLSGHIVQGHVDGVACLLETVHRKDCYEQVYHLPRLLGRYCVEKGSIAINGVSLTINDLRDDADQVALRFMLIPHTWTHTNLSKLQPGDRANVEVDVMAKYVERLCQSLLPH